MAKGNLADLQKALDRGGKQPAPAPKDEGTETTARAGSYKAPSRENKTPITAYLSPDYKTSLRLIQARGNHTIQALIAEALNDLFAKYKVPTVSE
jgi:Antitoxin-like ribbon-helix-helix